MVIGDCTFDAPMMASAMDGTVSPRFATMMHEMGGLGVLNGEGLYSRYDDPYSILEEITSMPQGEVTEYLQQVYSEPIKENLIGQRVEEIKSAGSTCAIAFYPPEHQAHVSLGRGGRGRHRGGPVHRYDGAAPVPQLPGPGVFRDDRNL